MTTWTLHATGRRDTTDWPDLARLPLHAAWADNDGFHISDHLPATTPRTTHLWAWTRQQWLRIRIDHPHWWGAALTTDTTAPSQLFTTATEPVEHLTIEAILHWPPSAGEIAQRTVHPGDALTGYRMISLSPTRARTATFYGTQDTTR
ncbi:hypothetical protein AB0H71_25505 [Nocardia sp. NPDC050697]|uniref:hypothetical protein n=1 Tax=Nocardia sp. NPDC050697 TaxID=3155158 RepID=UPI00340EE733